MEPPGRYLTAGLSLWLGLAFGQPVNAQEPGFQVLGHSFIAIQVRDDSAAADWYRAAFRMQQVNHLRDEDGRYSIRILVARGLTVELVRLREARPAADGPQLGLFKAGFHVDDIDAAHAWLRTRGAEVDGRVFTDSALRVRSFVFRDPEGNRLQVFQACGDGCPGGG